MSINQYPSPIGHDMDLYDRELLDLTVEKCKQVGSLLVSIDNHFVEECLIRLDKIEEI